MIRPVIILVLLLSICGCTEKKVEASPKELPTQTTTVQPEPLTLQRFIPVQAGGSLGALALDTKTGQLCKTWDWKSSSSGMSDLGKSAPLCRSLYADDFSGLGH